MSAPYGASSVETDEGDRPQGWTYYPGLIHQSRALPPLRPKRPLWHRSLVPQGQVHPRHSRSRREEGRGDPEGRVGIRLGPGTRTYSTRGGHQTAMTSTRARDAAHIGRVSKGRLKQPCYEDSRCHRDAPTLSTARYTRTRRANLTASSSPSSPPSRQSIRGHDAQDNDGEEGGGYHQGHATMTTPRHGRGCRRCR